MKIADKISLSFLAVAVIVSTVSGAVVLKIASNGLKKDVIARLQATARSREDHIETYLEFIRTSTLQFSESVTLEDFLKTPKDDPGWSKVYDDTMKRLGRTREAVPAIYEFLLMDTSGKVAASSNPASIGQDKSADTIFTGGQKEALIKDAYYSDIYNIPLISVAAPVKDGTTGKLLGVMAARITLDDLNGITTNTTGLGRTGETFIVNKYGYMVTPSRFLKDTFLKKKIETRNFRLAMVPHPKGANELPMITAPDYRGVMIIGTHEHIAEMPWVLITKIDADEALLPLRRLQIIIGLLIVLAPLVSWLMGRAIARRITEPIRRLEKGAEVIGTGILSYKVGTNARDEVGQLSRAFDTMTSELKKRIVSVHDLKKEVDERKKAEEAADKAAREWATTFDSMAEGVSLHAPDFSILNANKALCAILGKSKEELIGKKCYEVFHGINTPLDGCPMEKSRLTEKDERAELFEPYLGRWLEVSTSPVYGDGGAIANFVHVVADITEQKRLRDQLSQSQTMSALGRFSAGAAHEIKNPLGIILGGMEYLRARFRDADKESRETMGIVLDAVLRIDAIINALTGLAGPSEHKARRVDAKTMVDDTVLILRPRLKDRRINFSTVTAEEGVFVEVDIDQMQYALLSVMTNAADAMPGGGDVGIKVYRQQPEGPPRDGPKCVIEIADTGEGISEDALPKVFEPFFTTRRGRRQIGLGLTVAKEFVSINKGELTITSEVGKGTVVRIALPAAP